MRGRQLAWLAIFGPMTIVLTVTGTVASGRPALLDDAIDTSGVEVKLERPQRSEDERA